jgi:hypothetical protein
MYGVDQCKRFSHIDFNISKSIYNRVQSLIKEYDSNMWKILNVLKFKDIHYPTSFNDIKRFEEQNPKFQVNVFALKQKENNNLALNSRDAYEVLPTECISNFPNREYIIDLLLLKEGEKQHYVLIKNLEGFIRGNNNNGKVICRRCLNTFTNNKDLETHYKECQKHQSCKIEMPKRGHNKLYFKNHYMKSKLPFWIVFDFETVNIPIQQALPNNKPNEPYQIKHDEQQGLSYKWSLISDKQTLKLPNGDIIDWQKNESKRFRGTSHEEVINEFVKDMVNLNQKLWCKLRPDLKWDKNTKKCIHVSNMIPLTDDQEREFQAATTCYWCECEETTNTFILKRKAVRISDQKPLCKDCFVNINDVIKYENLSKEEKKKITSINKCCICERIFGKQITEKKSNALVRHHDHFTGEYLFPLCPSCNKREGNKTKFVPIFAHNLSGYDSHLFIKNLAYEISEKINMRLLPKSKETYISFDFGCLRFLDSLRQFGMSLDDVAKSLTDNDFVHTKNYIK